MNDTSHQQVAERGGLTPDRAMTDAIPMTQEDFRGALIPRNMGEAMEYAKLMATGRVSLPKFLQNNPGDCLRIVAISTRTGLDAFMLANQFYQTTAGNGETRMECMAQGVHAIVLASGLIRGDLKLTFAGEGEALSCTVTATTRNGTTHSHEYFLKPIRTKNSPLWKDQQTQQLGYYSERAWCRLYAPGAMLGVIAREDPVIDVTAAAVEEAEPQTAADKVLAHLQPATVKEPTPEPESEDPAPEPEAETGPTFSFVDKDGVVDDGLLDFEFRVAMETAVAGAPDKAALNILWEKNQDALNAMRAGTEDQAAWAAKIGEDFDARAKVLDPPKAADKGGRQGEMV